MAKKQGLIHDHIVQIDPAFLHLARIDSLLSCGSEAFDALPASVAGDETQGHGQGNIILFEKACDLLDSFIRHTQEPWRAQLHYVDASGALGPRRSRIKQVHKIWVGCDGFNFEIITGAEPDLRG
jgi:hypothetical protein